MVKSARLAEVLFQKSRLKNNWLMAFAEKSEYPNAPFLIRAAGSGSSEPTIVVRLAGCNFSLWLNANICNNLWLQAVN
jgi:hypothetical protein